MEIDIELSVPEVQFLIAYTVEEIIITMVYYLVYLSSSIGLFDEAELKSILSISRENNSKKDITGILLYHEGNILQVLEGDEERVKQLYEIIEKDKRHHGIITMADGFADVRSFPDWSMGFRAVSQDEWSNLNGFAGTDSKSILSRIKENSTEAGQIVTAYINNIR